MLKIGFVTEYSQERFEFAKDSGFDSLEVVIGPGCPLDLNKIGEEKIRQVGAFSKRAGVKIGTLMCSINHLDADPIKRKENNAYFIKILKTAKKFDTDIVCTNTWGNRAIDPGSNLSRYKEVFTEYADVAEEEGVKIAMENCPHSGGYPITIGNIGYTPALWEELFATVPSLAIGLEFDPSHLYWLGIDYLSAIHKFGNRIYSFHAKDTEILKENLDREGIYGENWWRYRLPGLGQIDWKGIFRALYDIGYQGDLMIEHEDPILDGDRRDEGLKLGLKYLRQFLV